MDKLREAQELENKAREIREQESRRLRIEKEEEEKRLKKENNVNVYFASDYAGMSCGDYSFYFGYEVTLCPKHGKDHDKCSESDCDKEEWCFTADKDGKELMRIPQSKLINDWRDTYEVLLYGIGVFINKKTKK